MVWFFSDITTRWRLGTLTRFKKKILRNKTKKTYKLEFPCFIWFKFDSLILEKTLKKWAMNVLLLAKISLWKKGQSTPSFEFSAVPLVSLVEIGPMILEKMSKCEKRCLSRQRRQTNNLIQVWWKSDLCYSPKLTDNGQLSEKLTWTTGYTCNVLTGDRNYSCFWYY